MRHPKIWGVIGFIMAVAMSILELATHDITCKYGMNPICFFWALRWAALCGTKNKIYFSVNPALIYKTTRRFET